MRFRSTIRYKSSLVIAIIVSAFLIRSSASPARAQNLKSPEVDERVFYTPEVIEVEGWTVKLDPRLSEGPQLVTREEAIKALANHLQRVTYIVPGERLEELRKLPIWLELENPVLDNMQYHPSRRWLASNGHSPDLVKHVHIPRAGMLTKPSQWAKHPYCILHELAHAYHDQVLGFDHPEVIRAFEAAKSAGTYESVMAHTGNDVRHYGLNNHKEYFAEATEAYFGVNDFYPFVRAELKKHDPEMFSVLEQLWGKIR